MRRIYPPTQKKIGAFKSVFSQDLSQRLHEQIAALWRKKEKKKEASITRRIAVNDA